MSYSRLLGSVTQRWTEVLSPVILISNRGPDLLPTIRAHQLDGFARMMKEQAVAAALAQIFSGEGFEEFLEQHVEKLSLQESGRLRMAVFDAALVFGHAILDDALVESLRIAQTLVPQWFEERVAKRRVDIGQIAADGLKQVTDRLVSEWITQQERESMPAKFRLLFSCTQPRQAATLIEAFNFDGARILELDELRHSVVHRSRSREVSYDDLDYLRVATNFAVGLLTEIGAKADPVELFAAMGIQLPLTK
jgi:hypothetical protein